MDSFHAAGINRRAALDLTFVHDGDTAFGELELFEGVSQDSFWLEDPFSQGLPELPPQLPLLPWR